MWLTPIWTIYCCVGTSNIKPIYVDTYTPDAISIVNQCRPSIGYEVNSDVDPIYVANSDLDHIGMELQGRPCICGEIQSTCTP